jgi:hypothetical protein
VSAASTRGTSEEERRRGERREERGERREETGERRRRRARRARGREGSAQAPGRRIADRKQEPGLPSYRESWVRRRWAGWGAIGYD